MQQTELRRRRPLGVGGVLLLILASADAGSAPAASPPQHPWEAVELSFTAERDLARPYVDGLPDDGEPQLRAVFTRADGGATNVELRLGGFWDGGRTWRIRFAPPSPGVWTYRTSSSDPGLDNRKGEVRCEAWSEAELLENPARRGWVRVCRTGLQAGRHFEYADGTPFLWIGDTWWNWTKRGIKPESFERLVNDRAAKGFSVGQLFFAAHGWGRQSSLLNPDCTEPDLEHLRSVERMIATANAHGISVWVHGWWSRPDMKRRIGEENLRRWWRYMVHRLGAYNVLWVLAGEYNMHDYGGLGLPFWKELGALVGREDPYDRLLGIHPTPPGWDGGAAAPQWSTAEVLHQEPWLDYNQSQTGHGRWRNELIPWVVRQSYACTPAKPIVVTEPWYEFERGNPAAEDMRFGAWAAVLSGAAGHSYGGGHVWKAHVPEAPAGKDDWPMEMDFAVNTLDYPGARAVAFMAKTLRSLDWWRLAPHPELIRENPSPFCAADPGRAYVLYLRYGGVVKVDLRAAQETDSFRVRWIDLAEEVEQPVRKVLGGGIRELKPPADYPSAQAAREWLVILTRG